MRHDPKILRRQFGVPTTDGRIVKELRLIVIEAIGIAFVVHAVEAVGATHGILAVQVVEGVWHARGRGVVAAVELPAMLVDWSVQSPLDTARHEELRTLPVQPRMKLDRKDAVVLDVGDVVVVALLELRN